MSFNAPIDRSVVFFLSHPLRGDLVISKALPERMLLYQGILADSSTHTIAVYHTDGKHDGGGVGQSEETIRVYEARGWPRRTSYS